MIGAAQRYRELFLDLMLQRALSDGELSPAQEARIAAELDHCWNAMTDEEQDAMEQWLATPAPPAAPDSLSSEDQTVERGAHIIPRKAA
jgi:hypothetical protein